jgi:hypothetical protein
MIACMGSSCDLPRRMVDRRQMNSADPGSALGKPVYHNPDSVATVLETSRQAGGSRKHLHQAVGLAVLRAASVGGSGPFAVSRRPWYGFEKLR